MDKGAWGATVLGVTKSRTRLKQLSKRPNVAREPKLSPLYSNMIKTFLTTALISPPYKELKTPVT